MNKQRKEAALKAFAETYLTGGAEVATAAMKADTKRALTDDEIAEILEAFDAGEHQAKAANTPAAPTTLNKDFEEWRVELAYTETENDETGAIDRKVKGKKKGQYTDASFDKLKKIRETSITEDAAEMLNSQSHNTGVRLYLKTAQKADA